MPGSAEKVIPLHEMTAFDVAEGDPDVRGWDVVSAEGIRVGDVEDLLVDTEAMTVRYLDVHLDRSLEGNHGIDHILIPMSHADLDEGRCLISLDGVDLESIAGLPRYEGELTSDLERQLASCFEVGPRASSAQLRPVWT